ncbi:1,4-dihydroxy-2-naphthoyl-CoA synthase [Paraburkholderia hiiakae]|uniref:1,4-dihydroxy-2-naphthoyl-CoA synthase n=2 Tax=Paraburkholderia hiiakae TaxID=1081782 RepID=A0ABM8NZ63_9BURK|nr:1,4-dihydroxy-2-naphthoyl-CoA synthase [Paraburkholderia hiiakae]
MAGGDVHAMHDALSEQPTERKRQIGKLVRHAQLCVRTIVGSRKPVMSCVNGVAAGFGLSLTAACDVVIAAEHATFASAYSRIGASSDSGSTFTLPQALGRRRAARWLYFAEQYSATEALRTFRAPPRTGLEHLSANQKWEWRATTGDAVPAYILACAMPTIRWKFSLI